MRTTWRPAAGIAVVLLAAAGCGSYGDDDDAATTPSDAAASDGVLSTAASDLGEIVVDAEGRTVYVFDRDTAGSGSSACEGTCLDNWPAVTADDPSPDVAGVSGEVGTIERGDGTRQVTLDGMPLYTYAGDADPGDVTGQGVQGVWWVVSPDGAKVSTAPSEPAPVPGY